MSKVLGRYFAKKLTQRKQSKDLKNSIADNKFDKRYRQLVDEESDT